MRANELMIGDWMLCDYKVSSRPVEKVTATIYSIEADRSVLVKKDISNFFCFLNEIEPIPLTPEILEANGFSPRNKDKSIWRKILDDVDYRIEIHFQCNGEIEVKVAENQTNYNYIVYHGNYIHCLQHALRLAGLDQIADNLVIEKGGAQ